MAFAQGKALETRVEKLVVAEPMLNYTSMKSKNNKKSSRDSKKCPVCNKSGHDEASCWTAHPELRPSSEDKKETWQTAKSKGTSSGKVQGL